MTVAPKEMATNAREDRNSRLEIAMHNRGSDSELLCGKSSEEITEHFRDKVIACRKSTNAKALKPTTNSNGRQRACWGSGSRSLDCS